MRDYINYDEIYIPPPPIDSSGNLIGKNGDIPSLWSSIKFGCYEAGCCADGTVYDEKLKMCVLPITKKSSPSASLSPAKNSSPANAPSSSPGVKSAFTTIDQAVQFGDLTDNYKILSDSDVKNAYKQKNIEAKPHTDLEFTEYKYKI
jgi:hypothetical protein